jgi:hypothetical protein
MAPISRKAFYERAQKGYCVIVTGETRAWGNFILRKGITVTPDAPSTDSNSHVSHFEWTGVGNLSSDKSTHSRMGEKSLIDAKEFVPLARHHGRRGDLTLDEVFDHNSRSATVR